MRTRAFDRGCVGVVVVGCTGVLAVVLVFVLLLSVVPVVLAVDYVLVDAVIDLPL